ncbi:MAG TPA: hypothetical protein ENK49_12625 [Gammaproteobacteria bacterium]|nr:hypothetical protein [Gammaproteobacteria bacterium]
MDEEVFNKGIRRFLKQVGITSQAEIESAVGRALQKGQFKGNEALKATVTLEIEGLGEIHRLQGVIPLE